MMKYNICLLAVNQLRDRIEIGKFKTQNDLKWLGEKTIPGGKSVIFNSIQLGIMKSNGDLKGEYGFLGSNITLKNIKNKLFTPNIPINLIFSYERGFSNFWTNYELLKTTKRIQTGAWVYLKDYPDKKMRQNQVISVYKTDPKFKELFNKEVMNVLQTEFIDKYSSTNCESVDI